jgi:hypothetical protein
MRNGIRITAAINRLRVDAWTAEVVVALRSRRIRSVLLKGPALARWLYADDLECRAYADADLMVAPNSAEDAASTLSTLGFVGQPYPPLDGHALHARHYWREHDGADVDLHTAFHGLEASPRERIWRIVSTNTDLVHVGDVDVDVPAIPVRLLHLVLHLGPTDSPGTKAWQDLERGIAQVPLSDWRVAVSVAEELGALHELSVRLRRLPEGVELGNELDIPHRGSPAYRLQAALAEERAPTSVLSLLGLKLLPDARSRLLYIRRKLVPNEPELRQKSTLARRGHMRLAAVVRVLSIVGRLPVTVLAWLRYYRE